MHGLRITLLQLIKVSRPLYILIFLVSFGYSLFLAKATFSNPLLWLQIAWLTIPSGIILFGLNDIYDYPSDLKNPRKGGAWGAILNPVFHPLIFRLSAVFSIVFLIISLFTFNILNIISTVGLLFVAWSYSVPPLRLKTRPPMEFVSNIVGPFLFILLAFSWGTGISGFLEIATTNIVLAQICWVMGLAILSYLADWESDKLAGDLTTVHWLGKTKSIFLSGLFYLLAAFLTIQNKTPIYPLSFAISAFAVLTLINFKNDKNTKRIYHLCWYIGIVAVILSIIFG